MKITILLDKFDKEIYWDDLSRAKSYYDYYIDNDFEEPGQAERKQFNKDLYACETFEDMADLLNDWYKKNEMLGHEFYVKEL